MTDPSPPSPTPGSGAAAGPSRRRWPIFDLVFGILLPILCAIADRCIFAGARIWDVSWPGFFQGLPENLQPFAYGAIGTEVLVLALWISFGRSSSWWGGPAGVILLFGALGSFFLGIICIPICFFGILTLNSVFIGSGLLVFSIVCLVSLFASRVFYRRAFEAMRSGTAEAIRDEDPGSDGSGQDQAYPSSASSGPQTASTSST